MNAGVTPLLATSETVSPGAMDKPIQRGRSHWRWAILALTVVASGGTLLLWALPDSGRSLRIDASHVTISAVTRGRFDDFVPLRGRITPRRTVFLDAIEGGRVEEVLVEDGALLNAGQLLVRLSNSRLQLEVIGREAEITEQQNNLSSLELSLERNRLEHKRDLVEADYQVTRLTRLIERRQPLVSNGLVSSEELQDLQDELNYWQRNRAVRREAQASDERLQRAQLVQIQGSVEQLSKNLAIASSNLDSLNVRAPVAGKLTAFTVEVGQSLGQGERFGQVDDPIAFKLAVSIDEFYLNRVDIGQPATVSRDSQDYALTIQKIYPQVRDGQFLVDMTFDGPQPNNIRRGQTLQTKLSLGEPEPALLIPNGAFYQDTGGKWAFVVAADGKQAVRRNIQLGRRNARFIEVLNGLQEGERIVTSPYVNYLDMQRLQLTN